MVSTERVNNEPLEQAWRPSGTEAVSEVSSWEPAVQACIRMTPALADVLKQFWDVPVRLNFFGASLKTHYFWRSDDFHVSQLMLGDDTTALLRLSDDACASLLNRVLGARAGAQRQFSFKQLSPLEATILNEFSRDVLACFMKHLVRKVAQATTTEQVHLVWILQLADPPLAGQPLQFRQPRTGGKIILSLPVEAFRMTVHPPDADAEPVSDSFFDHVHIPVRIHLGSARIPLSDLNQLERDDVVVLEDSTCNQMGLLMPDGTEPVPFPVEIYNRQQITMPYMQELTTMQTSSPPGSARQNLWDNLMIEVNAEFEPIRLPLKQLKQMSEGLVIEMGDLIHNQICLQVEGKTLARGELIIVGDKFGIRVAKVEAQEGEAQAEHAPQGLVTMQAATSQPEASHEEPTSEVADGDDPDTFLNDDFDEFFDDDEEDE